ncbi:hypothetical protein [Mesobacillus thioparans]|uniref:hypothetical protein n=1 Tax=Mesobacillus thioparans TaxID=370439 RepID=UPI0039F082FA
MWLNVDKPTKKVTLHEDNCSFIPITGTKFKKLNGLARDGGWLHFKNREEALLECEHNYREYKRGYCFRCDARKESIKSVIDSNLHLSEDVLLELREERGDVSWEYIGARHGNEEDDEG